MSILQGVSGTKSGQRPPPLPPQFHVYSLAKCELVKLDVLPLGFGHISGRACKRVIMRNSDESVFFLAALNLSEGQIQLK